MESAPRSQTNEGNGECSVVMSSMVSHDVIAIVKSGARVAGRH